MKKLFALTIALLIGGLHVHAYDGYEVSFDQTGGDYHLGFSLGETSLSTVEIDGQTYSVINFEGKVNTMKAGYAELPFLHAAVMLENTNNVDLHFAGGDYEDIQLEYPLLPSRGVIYRDQDPSAIPYVIDPKSVKDSWYPGDLANSTDPYILRDIRGTNVYVYPFQYNAATQVLRIYHTLSVEMKNNSSAAVNPLETNDQTINYEMDEIYASVFINYGHHRDDLTIGEMGDILVICTDRDADAIDPYILWKQEKGYNVSKEIVATGTNVVSTVQAAYDNNNNILYVQLVGDWADIKCNTLNGGAPPMDPQIGCVVGGDEVPDITVGRFSANSPTDVTTQVDKVIAYEKTPQTGATWYSTATGIGSNEGPGDDNEYDYVHLDVIFDDKLDPFTFDTYNDIYDPGAASSDVSTAVNNGTSIMNYCGHGWDQGWSSSSFSNTHVSNLTNGDMTPFIFSVACNNGDFHTGTCFAEAWQRKQGGGSVVFLGASISQPWNPPMRGQDYFSDLITGGYDYTAHAGQNGITTTEGRTTIGTIVFNSLVLMTTESSGSSDWETTKTWNLFGDPSMQVRTVAPAELSLSNQVLMVGVPYATTVTSGGSAVEGAMVTISQNGIYHTAVTDDMGSVEITQTLTPGDALIVVTAFNTQTIYETVTVVPADGPYVMYAGHSINDADGNGNGVLDYGESVLMSISLTNVGVEDAENVDGILSSSDAYVSITDGTEFYGTIPAGDTITITDGFALDVSAEVPDLHNIIFDIEAAGESTWNSSFSDQGHAPALNFGSYTISDASGNGNGKIDPGETVEITITLHNDGSADAFDVEAALSSSSQYIEIEQASMMYGPVAAGSTADQTYIITALDDTPAGHSAPFNLDITAGLNITGSGEFFLVVGQIPVLVVDMDGGNSSSSFMMDCFDNLSVGAEMVDSWPDDMNMYSSIFVLLGTYPDNYVLTASEGQELANYLGEGGNVYMEGGDTWYYDESTAVHSLFNINGIEDGSDDLGVVLGVEGTFTEGLTYSYEGDNSWIDHIAPIGDAFTIMKNQGPVYNTAVAYDEGSYRTIGSSHEFGGLEDGVNTQDYLMHKYLEFFAIESIWVGISEMPDRNLAINSIYPNPLNGSTQITYNLLESSHVSIEVYNMNGQVVSSLVNAELPAGTHTSLWDAQRVPEGMYFVRIMSNEEILSKKVIVMK